MRSVLVVDDDADLRESVAEVLRALGWSVSLAEDGERAIEIVNRAPPDVILLDVMMPRWSARDFVEALRHVASKSAREIPIVVFTASRPVQQQLRELGTRWVLEKPFEIDTLVGMLERALAPSR